MSNIVCITSIPGVGCTFLDWSIHFLSGRTQYYSVKERQWIPLTTDPITDLNAHGHRRNHPNGLKETINYINELELVNELTSFYPYPLANLNDDVADFKKNKEQQAHDYNTLLDECSQRNIKIVYVHSPDSYALYHLTIRYVDGLLLRKKPVSGAEEIHSFIDNMFFSESIERWNEAGLTNIWDHRERLALCLRPFNSYTFPVKLTYPHLWINGPELWYNGCGTIKRVMSYLELPIDPARLKQWQSIYLKWQQIQLRALKFVDQYEHIVDSIINNYYYEIDLTFEQEVVIQHCLIYQHNLNLKTWNLTKFPNNTQDLHLLLEPNLHSIENF